MSRAEITPYKVIEDYIAAHPGQTCTQIAHALGIRADSLSGRLNSWRRGLIVRAVWTQGQRPAQKAWRYFPREEEKPGALLFLAFRAKTGCAQYAFKTLADFRAWAMREPYRSEIIRVQVYAPKLIGDSFDRPAAAAVLFAEGLFS